MKISKALLVNYAEALYIAKNLITNEISYKLKEGNIETVKYILERHVDDLKNKNRNVDASSVQEVLKEFDKIMK